MEHVIRSLDLIQEHLESEGLQYSYRLDTDVVSFFYCGIKMNFFIVDDTLWCLSHSEYVLSIDAVVKAAILDSLEGSVFSRPVPNDTTNTVKFKSVTYMPDPGIYGKELFPKLIREIAGSVFIFRQKYIYYQQLMMEVVPGTQEYKFKS